LFFEITFPGCLHVGGALFKDGLFQHINTGRAEDIVKPGIMGDTSDVKGIFGEMVGAVFWIVRTGFFGGSVARFIDRLNDTIY
jgi:hypothetical protein